MKIRECRMGGILDIGFIDPDKVNEVTVKSPLYVQDIEDRLLTFLSDKVSKRKYFFLITSGECYCLVHILFCFPDNKCN